MTGATQYRSRRVDGDIISRCAQTVAYVSESFTRDDRPGKTYAAPEVRFRTAKRAVDYLDRLDVPGAVNVWSERESRRTLVAVRYADGTWSHRTASGAFDPPLPRVGDGETAAQR